MSQFCKDCKHARMNYGVEQCEMTREQEINYVTGETRSWTYSCLSTRNGYPTCGNFETKPTLIQRLKEVFS